MLFPNERIRSDSMKVFEIFCSQGPEFEELAFQIRLEIKRHG
jgi:hypothetical protein